MLPVKIGILIYFNRYKLFLLALAVMAGCTYNKAPADKVVARVGTTALYQSEISSVVPHDVTPGDSATMADDYIKKWVKQELMLQKAQENLSPEQKNVTKELQDYKNSLLIYRYKNELVAQRMDTLVTEDEILDFYTNNRSNFKLNSNIVKAIIVKTPNELANPEELRQLTANTSEEGVLELRDYCLRYAKTHEIITDHWVNFDLVANTIPETIEKPEQFLRQNSIFEMNDSTYYYFISILDYKLKNEPAPVEYVKDNIKNLILNRRKIEFLKQIENNIYTEGVRKNSFKIYNSDEYKTSK